MHPLWEMAKQINNELSFNDIALKIFEHQLENCELYRSFCTLSKVEFSKVDHYSKIPFLPISFFKTHKVLSKEVESFDLKFESSGTTDTLNSQHFIADKRIYEDSFLRTFKQFYGEPENYVFLCLLPNYLERGNSSLVYMCDRLIRESKNEHSGFYLYEWKNMAAMMQQEYEGKTKFVIGVTFALVDMADAHPMKLTNTIVMETGGMKGRREEWTREQLHHFLKQQWNIDEVHSEYGMTELLSQAYAKKDGIFYSPPFMKALIRDENDPYSIKKSGRGNLNIIELANIHSCSFIATDDIGIVHENGSFNVLGRSDHSALRGCSLMSV